MRDRRHRRDGADRRDAVRPPGLDRVDVRGGAELESFVPRCTHKAAVTAGVLVELRLGGVGDDALPGIDGVIVGSPCFAPEIEEQAAHVRVAYTRRLIGVPRERRATRAASWLLVGHVRRRLGIVRRLRLPRDDAVAHVDHPRARTRAVHAVCGAHLFVVAPAVAVELLGAAAALSKNDAPVLARCSLAEVAQTSQQCP